MPVLMTSLMTVPGLVPMSLAYLIAEAVWLLEAMRYLGAVYLIWLGISAFTT